MISRLFPLILLALLAFATGAEADSPSRPKPLPRPELQPLSVERVQQIQGVARAVLAAKGTQTINPRAAALRQALLDLRAEIGTQIKPMGSVRTCPDASCAPAAALAQRTERIAAKRQALSDAIAPVEAEPEIAYLAAKARAIDAEAQQAIQSGDPAQLRALYDELEPKSLAQLHPQTGKSIEPTFQTLTRHKPGVKGIHP